MAKKINLYCPLHGTQLEEENTQLIDKHTGEEFSTAKCKHEDCEHAVYIIDRQAYEQEGAVEIVLV